MLATTASARPSILLLHEKRSVALLKDEKAVVGRILVAFHHILDRFPLESGLEHVHLEDVLDGMDLDPLI